MLLPRLDRNGYSLFYEWKGAREGPVLILSHSLGTDHRMWDRQVQAFGKDFRILLYDHPGHGKSTLRPAQGRIADYGGDVLALLDSLKIEKASFCGLSLGGMVGIWLGAFSGSRFDKLLLCNTGARIEDPGLLEQRILEIRKNGLESITDSVLGKWFTPGFSERESAVVQEFRSMFLSTSTEAYAMTAGTVCQMNLLSDLGRINNPTLVVYGDSDEATPPAWNFILRDTIPGARALGLTSAHLSNIEAEDEFNSGCLEFLLG